MKFDPEDPVNKLCAQGMQAEGEGNIVEASRLFHEAWTTAVSAQEKFTAAHYVARHQENATDKLKWDMIALEFALQINSAEIKVVYPSLYLNIAKGLEDMNELDKARDNYQRAADYAQFLPSDGYGEMIKAGIEKGLQRSTNQSRPRQEGGFM